VVVIASVAVSGGASTIIDIWSRRVPNILTLGIAALGTCVAASHMGRVSVGAALAGFVLGFVLMLPGHLVGGTGAGDVKLFAAIGTLLGPTGIAVAFVYTAIAGGLLALFVAVRRRRLQITVERTATFVTSGGRNVGEIEHGAANNRFAYAPAIALGTLAAALGF